jgi:hypothetical protein
MNEADKENRLISIVASWILGPGIGGFLGFLFGPMVTPPSTQWHSAQDLRDAFMVSLVGAGLGAAVAAWITFVILRRYRKGGASDPTRVHP